MAPEWIKNLKDGDTLYLANRWGQLSRNVKVTKVGRVWLYLSDGQRLSRDTGELKDCYSYVPYPDRAVWEAEKERSKLQVNLITRLGTTKLTVEQIAAIEHLLDSAPKKI